MICEKCYYDDKLNPFGDIFNVIIRTTAWMMGPYKRFRENKIFANPELRIFLELRFANIFYRGEDNTDTKPILNEYTTTEYRVKIPVSSTKIPVFSYRFMNLIASKKE